MMSSELSDSPVRVCFIMPKGYPLFDPSVEEVFGGAEVDLYLLGTELAKDKGFDVSFITADYGQPQSRTVDKIKLIKSLDFRKNPLIGAVKVWRAMRQADADIYVLKTASPGTPLVATFCKLYGKVFIYRTAHQHECDGTYLKEHFILGRAFIWSLRKAKAVFAQNSTDKNNLEKVLNVASVVIPNAHRMEEPAQCERNSILWVGRSAEFKRPELFIEIAEKNPEHSFVMICQRATGDKNYDRLSYYAASVSNLEFHEHVSFTDIDKFFSRAKVFVNTSDSEGFPNTFIQAGSCSTAILSLRVDPDDFIKKYNCGVSCSGDFQKLVDSLRDILRNDSYVEMGENSRKYVEENHDIAKVIEQYKEIFTRLVQSDR